MTAVFQVVLGLALLIGGGAALVSGASQLANRLGISPMIVGLTVVGFGTSLPELVVNIVAVLNGAPGFAFGNVIGSNLSNVGLILGVAAVIRPIDIQGQAVRREVPFLLLATTIITVMALDLYLDDLPSIISRSDAFILMLLFALFLYMTVLDLILDSNDEVLLEEIASYPLLEKQPGLGLSIVLVLLGFGFLFAGGHTTVQGSLALSEHFGLSTTVIGLFIVALGTSMPELVTSVIAAMRKESDLALGNIIGSNVFNSLMVLPASALVGEIPIPAGGYFDLSMSWLLTAALFPVFFFGKARLGRLAGVILGVTYLTYMVVRFSGAIG